MPGNILVTGGLGYIGAHSCRSLTEAGYTPIVVDNLSTGHIEFGAGSRVVVGDIRDEALLDRVFETTQPIGVLHFAASAIVEDSNRNPLDYYSNNVSATISLLLAMKKHRVSQLVFSSSCATYGIPQSIPIFEGSQQNPINPYGHSKLICEKVIDDAANTSNLRHVTLRYFNAAGATLEYQLGERHSNETRLIPRLVYSGLVGDSVTVNGVDHPTPDGTAIRDYVHVRELARAHTLALSYLLDGGKSEFINLGSGIGSSVIDVIDSIQRAGVHPTVTLGRKRPGDPPVLIASNVKAAQVLGWKPKMTLDQIIQTALSWHRSELNL